MKETFSAKAVATAPSTKLAWRGSKPTVGNWARVALVAIGPQEVVAQASAKCTRKYVKVMMSLCSL